ncbi:g12847 [Coccomyxa viridis]|uniref:Ribosome-recycling factor, chloroplastic n=1 Tax=Coccomyxa viridis TaxID=1274662 RepID=A0ABP1GG16_9CHLO
MLASHTPALKSCRQRRKGFRPTGHHTRMIVRAAATEEQEEVDIEEDAMTRMEKSMESTTGAFSTVRTGRANAAMLDRIVVDYYGAPTPLKQIANLSAPESSLLVIQPYDKSSIQSIEKAIMSSDINLTPNNDGNLIRINVPQLTAERRKDMAKMVSKLGEEGKIAIRNIRRDCMKAVDKLKDASEDEQKALEDAIQELTDDYVKQVDKLVKTKQDELTTV